MKPEVGQVLFSLNVGNSARHCEQLLTEVVVMSVGRKYFTCAPLAFPKNTTKYLIENWNEANNYSARSKLYVTADEWEIEKETKRLYDSIREEFKPFSPRNITLQQLREIDKILNNVDKYNNPK